MFIESIRNILFLSIDTWNTDRKVVEDGLEFQIIIGSAQNVNNSKKLLSAHRTADKIGVPKKARNRSIFDTVDFQKSSVERDGQRYPKDAVITNCV